MKIVFYNETIMSGGIEKCIETLIEYFYKEHEIEIVYTDENKLMPDVVSVLQKRAYVHKINPNEKIFADVCIWCRLYMDYETLSKYIIATKNILWIHSRPRENENCILDNKNFLNNLDKIICVSETIKKESMIEENIEVIHNFLPSIIDNCADIEIEPNIFKNQNKLKLVTVSRLSKGKGFERVLKLVKILKEKNIDFEYIIIGKGRAKEKEIKEWFENFEEVKFIGYRENPYPYIKRADYLVQLSDYESWGNVITESKYLNTPVIITNFPSAYEQIEDDYNGIIIDLTENNYEKYIDRIIGNIQNYKNNLKEFKYRNEIEEWNSILNGMK